MRETPTPEVLLKHQSFVAALARRLLSDEHAAADVVQETWRAALEHPPDRRRPLRGWLATVVRNLAWKSLRSTARRAARERAVARTATAPSAKEILEREETRRQLLNAVLSLDEPYRSVLLLRYYEDRSVDEIASDLQVPPETVRTRIKRAIARLRDRLRVQWPGENAWVPALLPLARTGRPGPSGAPPAPSGLAPAMVVSRGIVAMSTGAKITLSASIVFALAVLLIAVSRRADETTPSSDIVTMSDPLPARSAGGVPGQDASHAGSVAGTSTEGRAGTTTDASEVRDDEADPPPTDEPEPPPRVRSTTELVIRVFDEEGETVPGCEVRLQGLRERRQEVRDELLTDSDGLATFRVPFGGYAAEIDEDGWYAAPIEIEVPITSSPWVVEIVAERMASLRGLVLGHTGEPLPGATVWVRRTWVDPDGSAKLWTSERRTSDKNGEYLLDEVVFRHGAEFVVQGRHDDYVDTAEAPAIVFRAQLAEAEVLRFRDPGRRVRGRVIDPTGAIVPGASLVLRSTREDEEATKPDSSSQGSNEVEKRSRSASGEGTFSIGGLAPGSYSLEASESGKGRTLVGFRVTTASPDVLDLGDIILDPPIHELHGMILAPNGGPAAGARIELLLHRESVEFDPVATQADEKGEFSIQAAETGPYRLAVTWEPPGEPLATVSQAFEGVSLDGRSLDLQLRSRGLLFGFVDAETGEPIRGWRGFITRFAPDEAGRPAADPRGRNGFTNRGALLRWMDADEVGPPGVWRFVIAIDGYAPATVDRRIDVFPIPEEIRITVRLERR